MPIHRFRHKGLERLFAHGDARGVSGGHVQRLRVALARLNASQEPKDMDLPGLWLHELRGERAGTFAVRVNANSD
jgi:proteic killer suppression protein